VAPQSRGAEGRVARPGLARDEAIAQLQRVLAREPRNGIALFYLGYALIDSGRCEEAVDVLREASAATNRMPFSEEGVGLALGLCGRRHERDSLLPWIEFMPTFDRLRPHPRFQRILSRLQ
jgi:tetratricopeptide (TPR) repeat protein